MVHAVVGGLVIAAIDNGMGLQGFSAASKYIVTAIVLLVAVTIDALARRGAAARGAARRQRITTSALLSRTLFGRLGRLARAAKPAAVASAKASAAARS